MALTAFRKIQIGKETTRGTLVAADKQLVGTLTMNPNQAIDRPVDEDGSLSEFQRALVVAQRATMRYEGAATYEQIIHFLAMALKGGVTPVVPGGGTDSREWTFTPNLITKNIQDSYTFEYGDDDQEWESGFSLVDNLELAFALNEVVTLRADLFARFPVKSTFTAALSIPAVNELVASNAKVFIDGTFAAVGTTQKSTLVAGATVRFPTGLGPVKYADGSLDFSAVAERKRHLEMDLDLVMQADAITEYDNWVSQADRAIRLEIEGAIIEGAIKYRIRVDVIGKYATEPTFFTDRDGENVFSLSLHSHKVSSDELSIAIINKETAL